MFAKKALRVLAPIKRQTMLQKSTSPFWTNLKLSILNNFICLQRQLGVMNVRTTVLEMRALLVQAGGDLDPVDKRRFYLSIQFLDVCNTVAAAA